jgi:hypothetical protein
MKSTAPGQLLGFTLQFPRALHHLLKCGPGDAVCIEYLGDVATLLGDGSVISEEDKSSVVGNPLTNKSTDLWKTFYNWIRAVNEGDLDIIKTHFVLYCNQAGGKGIVDIFNNAQTANEADKAIESSIKILADITNEHPIWHFYDYSVNQNRQLLQSIIERFNFQVCAGAGYEAILHELKGKLVPPSQIEFILKLINGWLVRTVAEYLVAKEPAIIKWEAFSHEFMVAFERSRRRELYDFTYSNPLNETDIAQHARIRPYYVQQLEAIELSEDEIIEAVTDYLRSKVNLDKWIEDEIIDAAAAKDFEARLQSYWETRRWQLIKTYKDFSEQDHGQYLLSECKLRQESLANQPPVRSTIAGTYHSLANIPSLGWHPRWKQLFAEQEEQ